MPRLTSISLLLFLFPLFNCAPFLMVPNATGDVFLGVWCPETVQDCHLLGSCYSSFKLCAQFNDKATLCASVPKLETGYQCQTQTRRLLAVLSIAINASTERLRLELNAQKQAIISKPPPTEATVQLLPGIDPIPNTTEFSRWRNLSLPFLFDFRAALQCHQYHRGPLCKILCANPDCATTTTTAITTPARPPEQCSDNFCLNGGLCARDPSGDQGCLCPQNFRGQRCEVRDWCLVEGCENGGTCSRLLGAPCICPLGWTGKRCEKKHPCSPNPCKNSATCSAEEGKVTCKCSEAWLGPLCERINPCSRNPCKNGGNCSLEGVSFKCSCPDNAIGDICQLVLQESFLDKRIFIIVVSIGISVLILITLFFGICLLCRRSKRIDKPRSAHLEATLRDHRRERHPSDVYAEIDSENCYSDGSESDGNFEIRVKEQRPRTRTRSTSVLFSSRAASCLSRDEDKTV